jgi:hypothetical protein
MQPTLRFVMIAAMLFSVACSRAAEEGPGKESAIAQPTLPAPLDKVVGSLALLEESGQLKIISTELGRTREFQEEALLWKIRVVKPLKARQLLMMLDRVAEVRFFRRIQGDQWRKQLLLTTLAYPTWLGSEAANGRTLSQDTEFEVYIPLDAEQVKRLQVDNADAIEFRRRR